MRRAPALATAELARLRKMVTQRGARMQIMRKLIGEHIWVICCWRLPEAKDFFDEDGVPR